MILTKYSLKHSAICLSQVILEPFSTRKINLTVRREEFFEKIFERYVGARPFKDLQTIVAVSRFVISAIFGHFNCCIRASAGAS